MRLEKDDEGPVEEGDTNITSAFGRFTQKMLTGEVSAQCIKVFIVY